MAGSSVPKVAAIIAAPAAQAAAVIVTSALPLAAPVPAPTQF